MVRCVFLNGIELHRRLGQLLKRGLVVPCSVDHMPHAAFSVGCVWLCVCVGMMHDGGCVGASREEAKEDGFNAFVHTRYHGTSCFLLYTGPHGLMGS